MDLEKQKNETVDAKKVSEMDAKTFYVRTVRLMLVGQVYFNNDKIK